MASTLELMHQLGQVETQIAADRLKENTQYITVHVLTLHYLLPLAAILLCISAWKFAKVPGLIVALWFLFITDFVLFIWTGNVLGL